MPMELADRPDLAPARDRRQRQRSEGGWVENLRGGFLKICDIPPSFLHCWRVGRVGAASEPCQRRVGACRRNEKKKKKKKRGHSPNTGIRRVVPVPVSDTNTTPKMACPCNLGLIIHNNCGEVFAAACERSVKELHPLCTTACVLRKALLFCQSISFSQVQVECNFAEVMELLISDKICSLEVAWILKDIAIIKDSFNFISFSSIPL